MCRGMSELEIGTSMYVLLLLRALTAASDVHERDKRN